MKKTLTLFICLVGISLSARDIVYKVSTYGDDANDGLTWATAKRTLGAAQAVAEYGDDIWVAAGTYYPTDGEYRYRWGGNSDNSVRYFSFQLKAGVRIYGGFPKSGNPDMNKRDFVTNKTIFSGNIGDSSKNTDNSYMVFRNSDSKIDDLTVLDGVYIQDGYTDLKNEKCSGLYNVNSSPLIRNTTFINNYGGAVWNDYSSAIFSECSFISNSGTSNHQGTAIYVSVGTVNITNSKFDSNSGVALYLKGNVTISGCNFEKNNTVIKTYTSATVSISNCSFKNNSGTSLLFNDSGDENITITNCSFEKNTGLPINGIHDGSTVSNCTFTGNSSSSTGCIRMSGGTVSNCTFTENSSDSIGAVSLSDGTITNCTFIRNSASIAGAISMYNGILTNSTFIGNKASYNGSNLAGAVLTRNSFIGNCTFTQNSASATNSSSISAGAVLIEKGYLSACTITKNFVNTTKGSFSGGVYGNGGSANISNCIIWGNYTYGSGFTIDEINGTYSEVYNSIIRNGYSGGSNIITADPKLLPLGNYGGSTKTMPVEMGSPAIGNGVMSIMSSVTNIDQRGFTRTRPITIGACEYQKSVAMANIETLEGEDAFAADYEFTLKVCTDADILECIWYKNGTPIEGATQTTLKTSLSNGNAEYSAMLVYDGGIMETNTKKISVGEKCLHVSKNGKDSNDGTSWATAKTTINAAIDAAPYGCEIWVKDGSYPDFTIKAGRSVVGGFNDKVLIKEDRKFDSHSTIINSDLKSNFETGIVKDSSIDGLKINGSVENWYSVPNIKNSLVDGSVSYHKQEETKRFEISATEITKSLSVETGTPCIITDCVITGTISFESLKCTDEETGFVGEICKSKAYSVSNKNSDSSIFRNIQASNISIYSSNNVSILDSYILNGLSSGIVSDSSDNLSIENCVVYRNSKSALEMTGKSTKTNITNCTFFKNNQWGIKSENSSNCSVTNTILWGNKSGQISIGGGSQQNWAVGYSCIENGYEDGVEIITKNPRILAISGFNNIPMYLALVENSPIAFKGAKQDQVVSSVKIPSKDIRGIVRETPTSIGAFEYIVPKAEIHISPRDSETPRGRDTKFSMVYSNGYMSYWAHSNSIDDWSWDVINGENSNSYSRTTDSKDKFNKNYYNGFVLDSDGGVKNAGYAELSVFDLLFVKQGATGKKDGSSWGNAFTDVATAINAAMKKSRIYIAAGTYAVNDADTTNTDRKQAFALKNDLEIYGGFPTEGSPELADRDISKYETILTADLLGDDEDADMDGAIDTDTMADNAYRVFFHPSSAALNETAVLDGVTIRGGYDDASEEEYKSGAGMHNNGSSPTIRNCSFVDNYSVNNGGGMYNVNAANPTIENCQFINNYAYYGGAVCDSGSSPSIKATEFSYNTAKYDGGAIRNNANSKPVIEDCDFANNSANRGAAIDAYESAPTAKRCSFSGNAATSSGGALYAYTSSNARLENCTLYNNSAYFGGGVYARENSNAQIVNCTISGNSAKYNGGALYSQNATPVIANSILWNNTAKTGNPEIYVKDSTPVINHCIVSGGYDGGVSVLTENPNLSSYGEYGGLTKSMPVDKTSSAWGAGILTLENIEIPLDDQSGSLRSTTAMTIGSMELHAAPTNLKATSGQYNDRVVLTWNASEDGKFYKVYRNTVNSPSGAIELTEDWITDLTYTDMAVEQGVNYYYFVRAAADVNGGSETWYSTSSVGYASKSTACNLTVVNGTGSGQYENGTQVAIVANALQEGQTFDKWIGDTTYIADINAAEAILTMPAADVTVTATYKAIEYYTLTVENGSGGGTVTSGDTVQIVADAPADGMVFDKWVGDVETVADISASTTTIRMPAKNATVTATYIEKPVVDPFGDAVVYPNVAMTILGEVDFFGSPANSGCVVAAYVGNELRGKSSVVDISGRSLVNLTVNVNANGEEIKFKIWTPSDGKIIDARADCTAISASGDSLGSLDSPFAIVFANDLNLELLLKEGWNQVSFNVGLENMAVRTILSDVIDSVALVQGSGTSFNPSWPDSLNTLKSFNNTSGFWVKMNAASSVSLTGSALDVSAKTISLKAGWNNIGYTPATAASIRTVLATALADGKIERIINSKGNFNPATPDVLNSLKTMTPGEGYWVKANAATTIAYDKITTAKRAMRKSRAVIFAANSASENFGEPVVYPNIQMTILANVLVNGAAAPSGSVVAAFVDGELRAKQEIVSLDGKSIANLTVSVAQNGETIGFKIWNSATGETLDFATSVAAESGAAPYTYPDNLLELSASGTPSVGGDTEPAEPVVYPNTPMSLYVEVQIDGKTVSDGDIVAAYVGDELRGKQSVVIYDGKAIANLVVNVASNGEKIAFKVWNASAKRLYAAAKTIDAEIGGEPYTYPDNLLLVNAQTATGGLALWTSKNGLSGDNANALATPFNDGITNIEKFAFGLSGKKAASYSENALFKQSYADGKANFQFPISKDAADSVNVKVMTSEDLVNWTEAPSASIGTSGDFNLMQTEQTVPEGGKLFFKLVVEEK